MTDWFQIGKGVHQGCILSLCEKVVLKPNIQKIKIMVSGPITSWEIDGKQWKQCQTLFFLVSKTTADGDWSHEIKRCLLLGKKSYDQPIQYIKKQRHYFAIKSLSSQGYGFPSSHVWMWEWDGEES